MLGMRTISKAFTIGGSLAIIIPSTWVEYFELSPGDVIEWEIMNRGKEKNGI